MKLTKLYKRATSGKIQEWEIEIDGNKYRSITGQQDGKKITNDWTTCAGKNIGRANATTPEQQAISEATAKWKKRTEKHYFEDIEDVDKESFFKCTLAKSYDVRKDKVKFPALYQHKLDGCRFIARPSDCHSRNGKPLAGMFAVIEALQPLFDKYPDVILDGEAFNIDYNGKFEDLVSLIKKDKSKLTPSQESDVREYLHYYVYDCPRIDGLTEDDRYLTRFNRLWTIIDTEFPELKRYVKKVDSVLVLSHEEIQTEYENSISQGYEGGILRWNGKYIGKRTWDLLKIKTFLDEEFTVVSVNEGTGNKSGTAGSVTLELPDGRLFNSNLKGGYTLYDKLWKGKEKLVGATVTCKFFEYTADGIPRFPYVTKIDRGSYE